MDFEKTIKKYQEIINSELERYFQQKKKNWPNSSNQFVRRHYDLLASYCLRNGKRLRPILTIMAYRAVGGKKEQSIFLPALAFELFHNYTLIHDDIYDEDEKRRGEWSNHILFKDEFIKKYRNKKGEDLYKDKASRFGVVAGFINGKILHALGLSLILDADIDERKKIAGLNLYREVSILDNNGQAIDLGFEEEAGVSEKDYYKMVLCKTGQLFKASLEWGAVLGGANESQILALRKYGEKLSLAFQMKDDLMDLDFDGGKKRQIGSDIKKKKKTLILIQALKKAGKKDQKIILDIFKKEIITDLDVTKVVAIFNKAGSLEYVKKRASLIAQEALKSLDNPEFFLLPKPKYFLKNLTNFMVNRKS